MFGTDLLECPFLLYGSLDKVYDYLGSEQVYKDTSINERVRKFKVATSFCTGHD